MKHSAASPAAGAAAAAGGSLAPLLEWLALGRAALAASLADPRAFEAQVAGAESLLARRTALVAALAEQRPSPRVPTALAEELRTCEAELARHLGAALDALRAELEALRAHGRAQAGYRPARSGAPAYVSRQV